MCIASISGAARSASCMCQPHMVERRAPPPRGVDALQAVERQVILPALDDRVGQHAGPGHPALDRQLGRLGHEHLGLRRCRVALRMNFGFIISTTTTDAGRRSSTSRLSTPICAKASSPSRSTSGGSTSIVTRGRFSGSGLAHRLLALVGRNSRRGRGARVGARCFAQQQPQHGQRQLRVVVAGPRCAFCPISPRLSFAFCSRTSR